VERRGALDTISKILLERETIDAEQFAKLLDGAPADEVFGDEEEETRVPDEPEAEAEKSASREGPRPMPHPRPGLAGGTAEMRADNPNQRS
jgi:hypothetical protein